MVPLTVVLRRYWWIVVTLVRDDVWRDAKSGSDMQLESPVHTVVAANDGKLNITGQCTIKIAV